MYQFNSHLTSKTSRPIEPPLKNASLFFVRHGIMQRIQAETQSSGRDTSYVQIQQNASKTREAVKSKQNPPLFVVYT